MNIQYTTFSEAGVRRNNEDYVRVVEIPEYGRNLFVLCDGMGGHAMGELASRTVGDSFAAYWMNHIEILDSEEKMKDACIAASKALDIKSDEVGHLQMGTTMVMAAIEGNITTIAHTGDSRCYVLRKGCPSYRIDEFCRTEENVLYQTQDHVNNHLGMETVTKCFFSYHPESAAPDIRRFEIESGDVIFLCSDGVDKYVRQDIMVQRLLDDKAPEEISDVIQFLCEKNSEDNYSGIIIQIR